MLFVRLELLSQVLDKGFGLPQVWSLSHYDQLLQAVESLRVLVIQLELAFLRRNELVAASEELQMAGSVKDGQRTYSQHQRHHRPSIGRRHMA